MLGLNLATDTKSGGLVLCGFHFGWYQDQTVNATTTAYIPNGIGSLTKYNRTIFLVSHLLAGV